MASSNHIYLRHCAFPADLVLKRAMAVVSEAFIHGRKFLRWIRRCIQHSYSNILCTTSIFSTTVSTGKSRFGGAWGRLCIVGPIRINYFIGTHFAATSCNVLNYEDISQAYLIDPHRHPNKKQNSVAKPPASKRKARTPKCCDLSFSLAL